MTKRGGHAASLPRSPPARAWVYTKGMLARSPRASVTAFTLLLGLTATACGGSCPTPGSAANVTPTGAPCRGGVAGPGPAQDPLTLLGGDLLVAMRVDFGAIRRHALGAMAERALVAMIRATGPREGVAGMIETAARTEVLALGAGNNGMVAVLQGSYTPADLAFVTSEERTTRRQHLIRHGRRSMGTVVDGRYLVFAEHSSVDGVLDRLDGLEDPAPQTVPLQSAIAAVDGYQTYFTAVGVPLGELREELGRERGFRDMVADARWAAMSVAPSSAGLEVRGRVHTVTEAAARVVLDASQDLQQQATYELMREAPPIAVGVRALVLATEGTDATLRWTATDPEVRDIIEFFRSEFEDDAARRQQYEDVDAYAEPVPTPGPAVAPAP